MTRAKAPRTKGSRPPSSDGHELLVSRVATASNVSAALALVANEQRAAVSRRFFKTGAGQYGEGDAFLGVTVPAQRVVAKQFSDLELPEVRKLLWSRYHEERLTALLILVRQFERSRKVPEKQQAIFEFYLASLTQINNWDLVDSSAPAIVGGYLFSGERKLLYELAQREHLWSRRVAILATQYFIRKGDLADTLALAEQLLGDQEDLIHKAAGWMLREVGHKSIPTLKGFLDHHAQVMPRTMLRYALEKLTPEERAHYMLAGRGERG